MRERNDTFCLQPQLYFYVDMKWQFYSLSHHDISMQRGRCFVVSLEASRIYRKMLYSVSLVQNWAMNVCARSLGCKPDVDYCIPMIVVQGTQLRASPYTQLHVPLLGAQQNTEENIPQRSPPD